MRVISEELRATEQEEQFRKGLKTWIFGTSYASCLALIYALIWYSKSLLSDSAMETPLGVADVLYK